MTLDHNQGTTDQGQKFGYIHGENGGYFFTWMPTLDETLDSIDKDETDGDGGLTAVAVRAFLASKIACDFLVEESI